MFLLRTGSQYWPIARLGTEVIVTQRLIMRGVAVACVCAFLCPTGSSELLAAAPHFQEQSASARTAVARFIHAVTKGNPEQACSAFDESTVAGTVWAEIWGRYAEDIREYRELESKAKEKFGASAPDVVRDTFRDYRFLKWIATDRRKAHRNLEWWKRKTHVFLGHEATEGFAYNDTFRRSVFWPYQKKNRWYLGGPPGFEVRPKRIPLPDDVHYLPVKRMRQVEAILRKHDDMREFKKAVEKLPAQGIGH